MRKCTNTGDAESIGRARGVHGHIGHQWHRDITVGNIAQKALFLGPAERADVVVDFSQYAVKTLILYNDSPARVPAGDPRNDYFTGDQDQTSTGDAPTTLPGYGPNTRTITLIHVAGTRPAAAFDKAALDTALPGAYVAPGQDKPFVSESAYNAAFGTSFKDTLVRIQNTSVSFDNGLYGLTGLKLTNPGSGYNHHHACSQHHRRRRKRSHGHGGPPGARLALST